MIGDNAYDPGAYGTLQVVRNTAGDSRVHISLVRAGNAVSGIGYDNGTNDLGIWSNQAYTTGPPSLGLSSGGRQKLGGIFSNIHQTSIAVGAGYYLQNSQMVINGPVAWGAAQFYATYNTFTGSYYVESPGFDSTGTTHNVIFNNFRPQNSGDNFSGLFMVHGRNASAGAETQWLLQLFLYKNYNYQTNWVQISYSATSGSFSVTYASDGFSGITFTTNSDQAIAWRFFGCN